MANQRIMTASTSSTATAFQKGAAFDEALREYAQGFGKKRKPSFVQNYLEGALVKYEDVQKELEDLEAKTSHKKVHSKMEPILRAVKDYTGVLDVLCMPSGSR
jgi:hypothetical protein